jgi:hypothetical protein
MILAINQPYWFPYIGYFQLISAAQRFVVYDDVAYIKGGWINRNRILIDGEPRYLTVPTQGASSFKPIREVGVDDKRAWQSKMLKTLEQAYAKAPQFETVFPLVAACVQTEEPNIGRMALRSIRAVADYLDITTSLVETSSLYGNSELAGPARVIDVCVREGATEYVNASGGMALYDRAVFADHGIKLRFVKPRPIVYRQFGETFTPWLSIIDVLMFNSRSQAQALLREFDLV